eukprot:CAMPEP_0198219190 /NCGR_PEP_ID=MMETSP1445-20131203/72965_1 /TAXON_ID=36898 /ORGANISM="Pyramimonas sp., Strain CCMP2087" /LENGTH=217 /DNA_ID=CAMNT_0043896513 /DNA_START=52 /DNA_END=702 /DNA_ORIENTATION=+
MDSCMLRVCYGRTDVVAYRKPTSTPSAVALRPLVTVHEHTAPSYRLGTYSSKAAFSGKSHFARQTGWRLRGRSSSPRPGVVRVVAKAQGKLVTVLGKGGAGKTTVSVALAKHFAAQGKKVLLVLQSEDQNGEKLLDLTLLKGSSPRNIETNLDVLRAYSTTLLEEPWKGLRETEAQLSFSGGILDEMTAEELPVLPGMDVFTALGALRKFTLQYDTV